MGVGADGRPTGRVVEWKDKGFGFIKPDNGEKDVFFHTSDVEAGPVTVGTQVTFGVVTTEKGLRAVAVRPAVPDPSGEPEADVLTPDELWEELAPRLRQSVTEVAQAHGWVD